MNVPRSRLRLSHSLLLAVMCGVLSGCATTSESAPIRAASQGGADHADPSQHHASHSSLGVPAGGGEQASPARALTLPSTPEPGKPGDVSILVETPTLRLAAIVLRGGERLPEHSSKLPVTIVAIAGAGTVLVGSERFRVDALHAVVLPANARHSVEPDAGTSLVVLVHHIGAPGHDSDEEGHAHP